MVDISKDVEYLRSRPLFSAVSDAVSDDALSLMAVVFRETLKKMGEDSFITLVELYEKGYIRVVSDEERDAMYVEVCGPNDAPQLKIKLH